MKTKIDAALKNYFLADSLSMPVHWFYNPADIPRYFPPSGIERLEAAPADHPSSIMKLHSTGGGGRGAQKSSEVEVVGGVILRGREGLWGVPNAHYHHGMKAGQSTLNAHCGLLALRHVAAHQGYDEAQLLSEYVEFMTRDPCAHPDTYAESFHRAFFRNWAKGIPVASCGESGHDTPSVGAFCMALPLALARLRGGADRAEVEAEAVALTRATHPHAQVQTATKELTKLLARLLALEGGDAAGARRVLREGASRAPPLRAALDALERAEGVEARMHVLRRLPFSIACYLDGAWPIALAVAFAFVEDPWQAMLANANLGGECCHRGALLGALVGAASGKAPEQFEELELAAEINKAIRELQ